GNGLARSRFADDRQHLALVDMERYAIDSPERAGCGLELDDQVFDFQKSHGHDLFIFGSSASRRPSPTRLIASTVIRMATPGSVTTRQARRMNSRASASMVPHSGVGGCAAIPRKPRAAASRIALEKESVACTISGAMQLGRMVLNMRSEEHTSELQSRENLVCRLLLEKKNS